jgi:hypothetical protein
MPLKKPKLKLVVWISRSENRVVQDWSKAYGPSSRVERKQISADLHCFAEM